MHENRFVGIFLSGALGAALFVSSCKRSGQSGSPAAPNVVWAAGMGELELLKSLEAKGESLNLQDTQCKNWTPLIAAVYHNETNVVNYLLTRKVNLDLRDNEGNTALIWAITTDNTNTVRLLLEAGADVTVTGKFGSAASVAEVKPERDTLLKWLNEFAERNRNRGDGTNK